MAMLIPLEDFREGYLNLLQIVLESGDEVSPRGMRTKEIRDCVFTLKDVTQAPIGVGRKLPLKIVATEAIQFMAGVSDLQQLDAASNGNFTRFSDDGITLAGAYGPRIAQQLGDVVNKLTVDPDSRQAGVTVWRGDENREPSKDVPCTLSMFFSIRDAKLHMSVTMRSNDVWLGTAIDVPVFCQLQRCMAWALGVEPGSYTHHAISLHMYEAQWETVHDLLDTFFVTHEPDGDGTIPALTDGWTAEGDMPFLNWYRVTEVARAIKEHNASLPQLSSVGGQWFAQRVPATQFPNFWADGYYRPVED